MKVITTNLLNRFWKNGVLPIKNSLASKLDSSKVVNNLLTTASGYALDARQGKALGDRMTAAENDIESLNGKLLVEEWLDNTSITYSADQGKTTNLTMPTKAGYKPIAAFCTATGMSDLFCYGSTITDDGKLGYAARNVSNTSRTSAARRFMVIWEKL